ncbi:MAG: methionyl-tRNA formyltransferase [Ignavibacteria bacterium]
MRIILMGSPDFGIPAFRRIVQSDYEVPAVVTVPDKKKGRGLKLNYSDVKKFALEYKIPVLQPENLRDEDFINNLNCLNPDIIVIIAFRILPKEIFTIPKLGSINLHASMLPKYRGAAPINRAIMNGESMSGITTFFLDNSVDTGSIILQKEISININDTFGDVYYRMSEEGANLIIDTINLVKNGTYKLISQDNSIATIAPKIYRKDCLIDWNKDSISLHNYIRGLSPAPSAYTTSNGKVYKVLKSLLSNIKSNKIPGTLFSVDKKLYVSTLDNDLEILSIQPEGKKAMNATDFVNGMSNDFIIFSS